jgi:CHAD domain-containing protein
MPLEQRLLEGPAERVARQILSEELARWVRANRRMSWRRSSDSLHDFRVALRRLRSTLRAFRVYLDPPKGLRRRLRRLARETNESRNLEIWQRWVREQAKLLTPRQTLGVRWLQGRLRTRKRRADARMGRQVARWFEELREELEAVGDAREPGPRSLTGARSAVAAAVGDGREELRKQLRRVHSLRERAPTHAARIAAKRLRYLLEPFRDELAGGARLLKQLELVQDILGEVHDAHVFADELRNALAEASEGRSRLLGRQLLPWPAEERVFRRSPPPGARAGLLALARRLRAAGEARIERLRQERRKGTLAELLEGLASLLGSTEASGRPDLNRRLPAPKAGALPD